MSTHALSELPLPENEPVLAYAPGSAERSLLRRRLAELSSEELDLPLVIGGEEIRTGQLAEVVMPHRHGHVLARVHRARPTEVKRAIAAAGTAWHDWSRTPWEERVAVFLRAADLLSGPWRATLNAATMLGQSKTVHQAEIDAACELADFWRFNAHFMTRIYAEQPFSGPGSWNKVDYRPLEGFVFAVTPFNFTAIAGNLPTSAALMGNTVVWKPASRAAFSAGFLMQLLEEAGLPPGVINVVWADGASVSDQVLAHPDLAGIHFTGSTPVFHSLWRSVGERIAGYRSYPRLVGETGGKDFILAHASADLDSLATAIVRGAFEYQGQKCSAASRLYIPDTLWPPLRERLAEEIESLRMGDVADPRNFIGAVIDSRSFSRQEAAIQEAQTDPTCRIIAGGSCDANEGWFVRPTLIETTDPGVRTMTEELFGPVVTAFVYPANRFDQVLHLVDRGSEYALTGAVFARERAALAVAADRLRFAAGNFYVNDKPTGAVVGQQPFGGGRASGTNDRAGSMWNLIRWTSPRTLKETFVPPTDYRYPHMAGESRSAGHAEEFELAGMRIGVAP